MSQAVSLGTMEVRTVSECPTTVTESGAVVLWPQGRLNFAMAAALRDQLNALIDSGRNRIVVELSAVESTDSSGLGVLIAGLKAARKGGGDLRIAAANEKIRAALALTQLDRVLKTYETADLAFSELT